MIKKKPALIPHKNRLLNHHFSPHLCMHIQNSDITPVTSHNYIWHHIANKLYSLNCWYMCVVYKKPFPIDIRFLFHSKNYNPLLLLCPLSHLTPCTPTKSKLYLGNSLAAVVNEPVLNRVLTFQVPNLISLFRCLDHTKVSVPGQGLLYECCVAGYVFTVRSC